MTKEGWPDYEKIFRQLKKDFYKREDSPERREVHERFVALGEKVGAHSKSEVEEVDSQEDIPEFANDDEAREFWATHKLGPGVPTWAIDLAEDAAEALEELRAGGGRDLGELLAEAEAKEKEAMNRGNEPTE